MVPEGMVREIWLRAEALCECRKDAHGHSGRCNQFLIWTERGEMGRGPQNCYATTRYKKEG